MLTLKVLNSDAILNSYIEIGSLRFTSGSDVDVVLKVWQCEKNIRYIPDVASVITADFLKSDGTTVSKTASFPFADDRSIIKFSLTASETADIISQNLLVQIVEGAVTKHAFLQKAIQKVANASC